MSVESVHWRKRAMEETIYVVQKYTPSGSLR